jgi:hypothetical protein
MTYKSLIDSVGATTTTLSSGIFLTAKGLRGRKDNECRDQGHGSLRSKEARAHPGIVALRIGEMTNDVTCVELALSAQLICFSEHAFACTDNGSLAHLIGVSACTGPGRSQPTDDAPVQRDVAVPVRTTGNNTSCGCVSRP